MSVCATEPLSRPLSQDRWSSAREMEMDDAMDWGADQHAIAGVTEAEAEALGWYSESGSIMNNALRKGGLPGTIDDEMLALLDSAAEKSVLTEDMIVYRAQPREFAASLVDGTVFADDAFVSTTMSEMEVSGYAESAFDAVTGEALGNMETIRILLPKGTHAAWVSDYWSELMVARGTRFRVLRRGVWEVVL